MLTQMYAKGDKRPLTATVEICETLSASYPENWWCVSYKRKYLDWAMLGKKRVGESAEWNNIGQSHKFDFYVYTVPIAHLEEIGGKCCAEKEMKAEEILESVAVVFWKKGNRVNFGSIADEVVTRLDKEGLNWVHICVSADFFNQSTCSEAISRVESYATLSKSRLYDIAIFLTA